MGVAAHESLERAAETIAAQFVKRCREALKKRRERCNLCVQRASTTGELVEQREGRRRCCRRLLRAAAAVAAAAPLPPPPPLAVAAAIGF